MVLSHASVVARMQLLIDQWEAIPDQRRIFLSCYLMMTSNMLLAIEQREFLDSAWVDNLLHRFAEYYFVALEAYEQDPAAAPPVWQLAHNTARDPDTQVLQKLLVGVNAHINYDLVLTLVELLESEWAVLSEDQRAERYADYCHVNEVIGQTIDAVQDQVLEPGLPLLDILDRFLGPIDEFLISNLINHWRETVWSNVTLLLDTTEPAEQARLIQRVEQEALRLGRIIT
ncbi:MAG: hypothetical protein A2W33_02855 [Chloroflexi bacterium RBG_16_52_11]|nr:MAG: hypothetical protein A2W33_02855 [Chloroflexi bacterium RBG_16_52_11]